MNKIQSAADLASYLDSTLLTPTATTRQITNLCADAADYDFASVCVTPKFLKLASDMLGNSDVAISTVISFPYGCELPEIKASMAASAIEAGANELDMVADLRAIVEMDTAALTEDISSVLEVCRESETLMKLIIEAAALTDEQKIFVCKLATDLGVDFIKTSTGTHKKGGAKLHDIKIIREYAPECGIKAAGGIRSASQALEFIEAGADRIGTSSAVEIINEFTNKY